MSPLEDLCRYANQKLRHYKLCQSVASISIDRVDFEGKIYMNEICKLDSEHDSFTFYIRCCLIAPRKLVAWFQTFYVAVPIPLTKNKFLMYYCGGRSTSPAPPRRELVERLTFTFKEPHDGTADSG
jgi:hypothetical protein